MKSLRTQPSSDALNNKQKQSLETQEQLIMIRQAQLLLGLYIVGRENTEGYVEHYERLSSPLGNLRIPVEALSRSLNFTLLEDMHFLELSYLRKYAKSIDKLERSLQLKRSATEIRYYLNDCQIVVDRYCYADVQDICSHGNLPGGLRFSCPQPRLVLQALEQTAQVRPDQEARPN